jgi:hypothetical protein
MMSAQPAPRTTRTSPVAIELDRPVALRSIVIRWGVSRGAIESIAPKGTSRMLELELRIDRQTRSQWVLLDPGTHAARIIEASPAMGEMLITQRGRSIHIESDLLSCYIEEASDGGFELIYARTAIFSVLGVPGGRYEPIGCELVGA